MNTPVTLSILSLLQWLLSSLSGLTHSTSYCMSLKTFRARRTSLYKTLAILFPMSWYLQNLCVLTKFGNQLEANKQGHESGQASIWQRTCGHFEFLSSGPLPKWALRMCILASREIAPWKSFVTASRFCSKKGHGSWLILY